MLKEVPMLEKDLNLYAVPAEEDAILRIRSLATDLQGAGSST